LTFGQIVRGVDAIVIQKGKKMIALFMEPIAHDGEAGIADLDRKRSRSGKCPL
jgi:hypothetical protein